MGLKWEEENDGASKSRIGGVEKRTLTKRRVVGPTGKAVAHFSSETAGTYGKRGFQREKGRRQCRSPGSSKS